MEKSQKIRWQKNKGKVAGAMALAIGLLLSSNTIVYATEPDYSQEITPEMELEGTTGIMGADEDGVNANRISVGNGIIYDKDTMLYGYSVGDAFLYANVLDGMLTQSGVELSADEGVEYTVYRESDPYTQEQQSITEEGNYTVTTGQTGSEKKLLSFTIIGSDINAPASYAMPTGCVVTSESIDGEEIAADSRSVDLTEEGHYVVSYRCVRNNVSYTLDMTVDHTAPELTLEGVKDGKARGEVTIKDLEEGASLTVIKDGTSITARMILSQPGAYTVKVTDRAGNSRAYSFYILFYLNAGSISFGLILLVAMIALGIYLYVSRKRLRIR